MSYEADKKRSIKIIKHLMKQIQLLKAENEALTRLVQKLKRKDLS